MELPSFYSVFLRNILRLGCYEKAATFVVVGAFFLLSALAPSVFAQVYPTNLLKQDIAGFLAMEYEGVEHERIDISVGNLDSRLRLNSCAQPVVFTVQDPIGLGGNISVNAQCNSGKIWSVHVPAQVTIYRQIPIAARDVARGEVINQAHLETSLVNISSIRQAFLPEAGAIIGREAKRNIARGEPFKTALLDAPTVVKRGEVVVLESQAGSLKVSSAGTAMADGRIGQKIRVRNNSSERIISGVVISQGIVQTL